MKDINNNTGYTFSDYIEGGRQVAKQIKETGTYPSGTVARDWIIIAGVAVYTPYIPLYQTPEVKL
jgi:hypothetical protein